MTDERRNGDRRTGKEWKPPSYAHYAKEWLVDTAHLSLEEQGAFARLLDHQWLNTPLPSDERDKAKLLAVTLISFRRIWRRIGQFFPNGANPRLEEIRAEQLAFREQRAEAGRRSVAARNERATEAQRERQRNGNEAPTERSTDRQMGG